MSKPPEDDKTIYGDPLATMTPILLVLALVSGWVGFFIVRPSDQHTPPKTQEQQHENQH
jgi:hypothetical protein